MQTLRRFPLKSYLQSYRNFATSKLAIERSEPFALPSARLRALITLYHRSSTFITPANLSRRIDLAFTDPVNHNQTVTSLAWSYAALQNQVKRNQSGIAKSHPLHFMGVTLDYEGGTTWSDKRGVRRARVNAILWGTQVGGKPALETVQETSATNERAGQLLDETADPRGS